MGCKHANGSKCCYECIRENCKYKCMGFNAKGKNCEYFLKQDYECVYYDEED